MAASHIFKVLFVNQGKVYEIYARKVSQGRLFGFIDVEELTFGQRSAVLLEREKGQRRVSRRRAQADAPDGWRWRSSLTREDSGDGAVLALPEEGVERVAERIQEILVGMPDRAVQTLGVVRRPHDRLRTRKADVAPPLVE